MSTPPEHLLPLIRRVRGAPVKPPPPPWQPSGAHAIGGLSDVGFGRGSDLLLVVSSDGRGVFDCIAGVRVARDRSNDDWRDMRELEAQGMGPLAGQRIRTSGIAGGGLALRTVDGWEAERLTLDWPEELLLLLPPGGRLYEDRRGRLPEFTKVAVSSGVRAWGFSPTGRSLVLATSSDVTIFSRVNVAARRE
jgi:hypothetical protein